MSTPFTQLGIPDDLNQGIEALGILEPTPIQEQAIPFLMQDGGDLIAQAQTGTGKTAAFGLPLLTKIDPTFKEIQALIIAPTRELAQQIGKQLFRYTKFSTKVFVEVVAGGGGRHARGEAPAVGASVDRRGIRAEAPGSRVDVDRRGVGVRAPGTDLDISRDRRSAVAPRSQLERRQRPARQTNPRSGGLLNGGLLGGLLGG